MICKKGLALIVAWAGLVLAFNSPVQVQAQVEWRTSLNRELAPVALSYQYAVSAPDGSIYTVAEASDGESSHIRLSRLSASGT